MGQLYELPQRGVMEYVGQCWAQFDSTFTASELVEYGKWSWRKNTLKFAKIRVIYNPRKDEIEFHAEKTSYTPDRTVTQKKILIHKDRIIQIFYPGEVFFKHPETYLRG